MRYLFVFLLVFSTIISLGKISQEVDLSTPYHAIYTHLKYLQPDNYNDSIAALPFLRNEISMAKAKSSAVKLKRILDGKGLYIYLDEIPRHPNYYDSTLKKHQYILVKEYYQISILKYPNGNWYFSDSSIDEIDKLYEKTFRLGTGVLLDFLPRIGNREFFGLFVYQYIALLIIIFISLVIYNFFSYLAKKVLEKILLRLKYINDDIKKNLQKTVRPTSIIFIILLMILFIPVLQLPPQITHYVSAFLRIVLPLYVTILLYRTVNILSVYLGKLSIHTQGVLDNHMIPLIQKILKTIIIIIGSLFILDNLNIPILPLLTGLSIGGLAFALAAQDTIKNFFGSIMIFLDKPFQVGDWITTTETNGIVEEVGFRSSRIRTFTNSVIYVPNGKLADNIIDNHGLRKYRRFYTIIDITYDTPAELIELFISGLKKIVENHPKTQKEKYYIYLNKMNASSLGIMFYIFFEAPNWEKELKYQHEILISIIKLANKTGVRFAFPTQTLHIENLPGQPSLSPKYFTKEELDSKFQNFFTK